MSTILTFFLFTILAIGCQGSAKDNSQGDQESTQGVTGVLMVREGDFMPSPEENTPKRGTEKPASGQVYVYQAVSVANAGMGPYYNSLGKPLHIVKTDKEGKFIQELPAGTYSLFIKTEQGLYANTFDGQGIVNPVTVEEGVMTEVKLVQDNQATY